MKIKLSKKLVESIDDGRLKRFGIDISSYRYNDYFYVELRDLSKELLQELHDQIKASQIWGSKVAARDIRVYAESITLDKYDDTKIHKVEFFSTFLQEHMRSMPRHHLYQYNEARGCYYCCYVQEIEYHETRHDRDYTVPEHVTLDLCWNELGKTSVEIVSFSINDITWKKLTKILSDKNLYFETEQFRTHYLKSVETFEKTVDKIGKQYKVHGSGSDDVDSAESSSHHWRWSTSNVMLEHEGKPTNCVVDVFKETDEESSRRSRENSADLTWWYNRSGKESEDGLDVRDELPVHPNLVIFSFKKFARFLVHVDQLSAYRYDLSLGDKLILPQESLDLIHTLVSYEGGFQDIIANKGGGAIVLCAGAPGTGKTLTAEVYSEVMKRPLYTVQCSQLGTDPDELEKSLLIVFARAQRWNAILLLDEADVYVSERGNSLQQNAIVGVFLRVMEYYHGVMFMTTNRGDIVDDAVASRCIARITYENPTPKDLAKIWDILAKVQGLELEEGMSNKLALKHPGISGRDVKNLLKLAGLVSKGKPITVETVEFVKKFKPTK